MHIHSKFKCLPAALPSLPSHLSPLCTQHLPLLHMSLTYAASEMRCNFIAIKHSICSPSPGMFINEIWAKVKFVHRRRHSLSEEETEREREEGRKTVDNVNRSRKTNSKSKMAPQNFACCCGVASRFLAAPKTLTMRICCRLLQKFKYTDKRGGEKRRAEEHRRRGKPGKALRCFEFCLSTTRRFQQLLRQLHSAPSSSSSSSSSFGLGPLNSLDSYNCTLLTFRRDCPRTVFKL